VRRLAIGVTVLATLSPAPAAAGAGLPPGVHINPNSPASSQYRIPIANARNETGGGNNSQQSAPALFGSGVIPPGGGTPASSASAAASISRGGTPSGGYRNDPRPGGPADRAPAEQLPAADAPGTVSGAGSDAWIPLIVGGGLVLAVGGTAGLLALRHPRPVR